jgi:hypothetical protein
MKRVSCAYPKAERRRKGREESATTHLGFVVCHEANVPNESLEELIVSERIAVHGFIFVAVLVFGLCLIFRAAVVGILWNNPAKYGLKGVIVVTPLAPTPGYLSAGCYWHGSVLAKINDAELRSLLLRACRAHRFYYFCTLGLRFIFS